MQHKIYTAEPKIGLVIGTFAAIPYIHLQLEARKRYYPHVPVLVHDDCSPLGPHLKMLCKEYDADFIALPFRTRHCVGDMSCYVRGADWAKERGLDTLVKFSRRFIPLFDWTEELKRLALETQMPTYSQRCRHFNFGFRTECIAFHLPSWAEALEGVRAQVEANSTTFVEGFIHNFARGLQRCEHAAKWEAENPRSGDWNAYAVWNIMADKRVTRQAKVIWHDSDEAVDYARVAHIFGLPYPEDAFNDPNQGFGIGRA